MDWKPCPPGGYGDRPALAALRRWRRRDNPVKAQFSAASEPRTALGTAPRLAGQGHSTGFTGNLSETGVVRFENVGLRYGLGPEVLRDLTFRIEPHSFQFLTGPSGAGKTSLPRLLFLPLAPAPAVPPAQADAWPDPPVRPRRRHPVEGRGGDAAPPHRHRVPGFPPARSHDHL